MIQSKTNTVKNVTMNTQGHVLSHITKTGSYPAQELLMRQVQFQVNMHVNTSCVGLNRPDASYSGVGRKGLTSAFFKPFYLATE